MSRIIILKFTNDNELIKEIDSISKTFNTTNSAIAKLALIEFSLKIRREHKVKEIIEEKNDSNSENIDETLTLLGKIKRGVDKVNKK